MFLFTNYLHTFVIFLKIVYLQIYYSCIQYYCFLTHSKLMGNAFCLRDHKLSKRQHKTNQYCDQFATLATTYCIPCTRKHEELHSFGIYIVVQYGLEFPQITENYNGGRCRGTEKSCAVQVCIYLHMNTQKLLLSFKLIHKPERREYLNRQPEALLQSY